MKVYISADIEGVTDVTSWAETGYGGKGYEQACAQMTAEVAAACRGALKAGAEEVLVKDSHDGGMNIIHKDLPKGVKLVRNWCKSADSMMACVDMGYDVAFMVGYHSEGGDEANPLAHTMSHTRIASVHVNGKRMAEMDINALICAQYNVPVGLVTGDKGLCEKAEQDLPGTLTVAVKEGIGSATLNMHPDDATALIEKRAAEAVKAFKAGKLNVPAPQEKYELIIKFNEHFDAKAATVYPGAYKIDEHTTGITCKTLTEMLAAFNWMH